MLIIYLYQELELHSVNKEQFLFLWYTNSELTKSEARKLADFKSFYKSFLTVFVRTPQYFYTVQSSLKKL